MTWKAFLTCPQAFKTGKKWEFLQIFQLKGLMYGIIIFVTLPPPLPRTEDQNDQVRQSEGEQVVVGGSVQGLVTNYY